MAEENDIPFSPLDSLGPQFGNIDPVNSNPAAYENWENRSIMNDQGFPVAPDPGLYRPQREIREDAVGRPDEKPPIQKPDVTFQQILNQQQATLAGAATKVDRNDKNQIYSYNDGPNGDAFYDRYAAYGADKMDEIGFHPFRDNESIYNARTTGWNDFSRMMSNSFLPLVGRGFISGPKSMYRILSDFDFSEDKEDAKVYERAAAIGQSSRGGLGSFLNNTMMNFGYTAGIMTEAILEEAALVGLAPTTFGTSLLGTAAVGAKTVKGIGTAIDVADNVNKTLKAVNSVKGARNFWNTSVGAGLKFINPIENITDTVKGFRQADNLTMLAKGQKTFGAFYRDARNLNMALAEARLEGGFASNQVQDRLYEDYYAANGEVPSNEMQYDFAKQAKKAATESMMWNTALIFGTNKIVFPNIMRPRGGVRNFLTSKIDDIKTFKDGKIVYRKAKDGAKGEFKYLENNLKNTAESFFKDPFRKSLRGALSYFKGNVMEGIQEVAQEVIGEATENYYVDAFKQKNRQAFHYGEGVLDHAVKSEYFPSAVLSKFGSEAFGNQMGAQGFETFASGFFMGMFAKPLNAAIPALSTGYNKYFTDGKKYNEYKEIRNNYGIAAAQSLNNLYADPAKFFDSRLFNYSVQNSLSKVGNDGTTKEIADANDMAIVQQVMTALDHGTFDLFTDHLESFKGLSTEEFEQAFGFAKGTGGNYQQKIDNVVEKSRRIKSRYDFYKERFPNPVDLKQFKDKDSIEYGAAALLKSAWDMGVHQAVMFNESFENVSGRLVEISNKLVANAPLKDISSTDVQVLLSDVTLDSQLDLLKGELRLAEESEQSVVSIPELKKKVKALEDFKEAKEDYKKYMYPERYVENFEQEIREKLLDPAVTGEEAVSAENIETYKEEIYGKRSEERDIKERKKLEDAYKNYMTSISKGQPMFSEKLEESFNDLTDYYQLQDEAQAFVYYTNALHNPDGFIEQVKKNESWMTKMYDNRKDYFTDMVQGAMQDREKNAILNALANDNVFIDPDAFNSFMAEGIEPEEFFDNTTKQVIPKGNSRYKYYFQKLAQARALSNESDVADINEQTSLETKIALINKRREKELGYLKGEEKQIKTGSILPTGKNPSFKITRIMSESSPGDKIVAYVAESKSKERIEFTNEDGVLIDQNGERVDAGSMRKLAKKYPSFTVAEIFTTTTEVDAKQVERINKKFDDIIEDVKENFIEYQKEDTQDYMSNPTREKLKALDRKLYNKINALFEADPGYAEEIKNAKDQVQKDNLFNAFVASNSEAQKLLKEYFNQTEAVEETDTTTSEEVSEADKIQERIDIIKAELNLLEKEADKADPETGNRVLILNSRLDELKAELKDLNQEAKETKKETTSKKSQDKLYKDLNAEQKKKVKAFESQIKKAASKNEIDRINGEIFQESDFAGLNVNGLNLDTVNALYKLAEQRLKDISGNEIVGVAAEAVSVGDNVQVLNPKGVKITPTKGVPVILANGTVVKVSKKSENSVTLNAGVGENSLEYEVSVESLKKNYGLAEQIKQMETESTTMTEQEQKHVNQSEKKTDTLLTDAEKKEELRKAAEQQGKDDATDELLDDINCGS